jgi:hypothetical protein
MTSNSSTQKLILTLSCANLHNFSKTTLKEDYRQLIWIGKGLDSMEYIQFQPLLP